jgi:hypothetical protein
VALICCVAAVVLLPVLRGDSDEPSAGSEEVRAALEARKEAKYREIRDAELDFRTGKLSEGDYRALDRSLRAEAIEILKQIDALPSLGNTKPASPDT